MLRDAALLREIFPRNGDAHLIFNDRPDLALLADFDGVHVGQGDVSAEDARSIVGATRWVGVSTNSAQQVSEARQDKLRLHCVWSNLSHGVQIESGSYRRAGGLREARGLDVETTGCDRRNYKAKLSQRDRCRSGFAGRDF